MRNLCLGAAVLGLGFACPARIGLAHARCYAEVYVYAWQPPASR